MVDKAESQACPTLVEIDPRELTPHPSNTKIYKPINRKDPDVKELSRDIAANGVLEPLVISADNFIISGHRRREAAILAGLETVPCRKLDIKHDHPNSLKLLVNYNRQRIKNRSEQLREAIIRTDKDQAYRKLMDFRREQSKVQTPTMEVKTRGRRKRISKRKFQMVEAVIDVVNANRKFWPLSDRQVHYRLLNNPPLRNTKRPNSRYKNNQTSYNDLCDILTRLRLEGKIPMKAISDPTRPSTSWYVFNAPQEFAREQLDKFLKGYRRNLQQTQPLHYEVVAEKLTLEGIIRPVCARYHIPYTIGRGYSSLPARNEIVSRFLDNGKEKLCMLVLSDFDPEGVNIGESLLQSIREDFGIENAQAVRVALLPEHITRFGLSDSFSEAKRKSARYKDFVKRFGKDVYELEALEPEQLQEILSETIDRVIDTELFNAELQAEKEDAAYLQAVRERIHDEFLDLLEEPPEW